MVRLSDRPTMTIAVDLGRKATNQTNYNPKSCIMQKIFFAPEMYSSELLYTDS